jgi:hypothetical protein
MRETMIPFSRERDSASPITGPDTPKPGSEFALGREPATLAKLAAID